MCDLELNFFTTKNKYVIKDLVDFEEDNVKDSYSWYKGRKSKSHGAFIKKIGTDKFPK